MEVDAGRRVVVINQGVGYDSGTKPFPPIGTVGTVLTELDIFQEYDVLFDNYPCPTDAEPSWVTHKSMIVFLDGGERGELDSTEEESQEVFA